MCVFTLKTFHLNASHPKYLVYSDHIGIKYSLTVWGGGGMSLFDSTNCLIVYFLFYVFVMTKAVSNREISFIKAVLLW